jgi:hypothetical protein
MAQNRCLASKDDDGDDSHYREDKRYAYCAITSPNTI